MYKVGIDARLFSRTGVGVYLRNLLYYLEQDVDNEILFYIYILDEDDEKIKFKNNGFIKKVVNHGWHSISEQIGFAKKLYQDNLDLMHFTYFSYPVLYKRKFVATIHDTTPLNFKTGKASTKNPLLYKLKHIAFKFVISQQIKNAQAIISPTKTVKKQLLNIFGNKYESKIFPIYEGIDYELMNLKNISSNVKHLTSNIPFFIYVGNFYPHKNVERLIQAFAKVKKDIRLILLGPDDYFSKRLFQLINRLKQEKRIVFYHNPSRDDLVFFYKNAQALIHPSLSEGFGLPLAEAAYFKLPIIASNIDVFREILDGNYISFNPTDVNDIAAKIKQFLSQKIKYSYDSVLKKFSFKAMTNKTLEIYQKNLRQEADI